MPLAWVCLVALCVAFGPQAAAPAAIEGRVAQLEVTRAQAWKTAFLEPEADKTTQGEQTDAPSSGASPVTSKRHYWGFHGRKRSSTATSTLLETQAATKDTVSENADNEPQDQDQDQEQPNNCHQVLAQGTKSLIRFCYFDATTTSVSMPADFEDIRPQLFQDFHSSTEEPVPITASTASTPTIVLPATPPIAITPAVATPATTIPTTPATATTTTTATATTAQTVAEHDDNQVQPSLTKTEFADSLKHFKPPSKEALKALKLDTASTPQQATQNENPQPSAVKSEPLDKASDYVQAVPSVDTVVRAPVSMDSDVLEAKVGLLERKLHALEAAITQSQQGQTQQAKSEPQPQPEPKVVTSEPEPSKPLVHQGDGSASSLMDAHKESESQTVQQPQQQRQQPENPQAQAQQQQEQPKQPQQAKPEQQPQPDQPGQVMNEDGDWDSKPNYSLDTLRAKHTQWAAMQAMDAKEPPSPRKPTSSITKQTPVVVATNTPAVVAKEIPVVANQTPPAAEPSTDQDMPLTADMEFFPEQPHHHHHPRMPTDWKLSNWLWGQQGSKESVSTSTNSNQNINNSPNAQNSQTGTVSVATNPPQRMIVLQNNFKKQSVDAAPQETNTAEPTVATATPATVNSHKTLMDEANLLQTHMSLKQKQHRSTLMVSAYLSSIGMLQLEDSSIPSFSGEHTKGGAYHTPTTFGWENSNIAQGFALDIPKGFNRVRVSGSFSVVPKTENQNTAVLAQEAAPSTPATTPATPTTIEWAVISKIGLEIETKASGSFDVEDGSVTLARQGQFYRRVSTGLVALVVGANNLAIENCAGGEIMVWMKPSTPCKLEVKDELKFVFE